MIDRLLGIDVSAPVGRARRCRWSIRGAGEITDVRMAGPAFTVLAEDDHLPVMTHWPRPRLATSC